MSAGFALTASSGTSAAATSVGGTAQDVTPQEADVLLTIGLYHLTSRARSPAAFLARGSEQTVLGDLTGWRPACWHGRCEGAGPQCGGSKAVVMCASGVVEDAVLTRLHGVPPCRVQHLLVLHQTRQSGDSHAALHGTLQVCTALRHPTTCWSTAAKPMPLRCAGPSGGHSLWQLSGAYDADSRVQHDAVHNRRSDAADQQPH